MWMDITTACDENGYLTAMKAVVRGRHRSVMRHWADRFFSVPVPMRRYGTIFKVIDIDGTAVYTNNPPTGAFRGFGVTQTCFGSEMNLNLLAEKVGITPWEIRYRNAIRPGQVLPNGQIADPSTEWRRHWKLSRKCLIPNRMSELHVR